MTAAEHRHPDHDASSAPARNKAHRSLIADASSRMADSGVRSTRPEVLKAGDSLDRLDHVDRLALVGTYTASVVHELSNPTTFVLTNLSLVREQLGSLNRTAEVLDAALNLLPPHQAAVLRASLPVDPIGNALQLGEMVQDSLEGIERIAEMIQYLRTYVRQDGRPARVSLDDVVRDALRFMRRRIVERAHLELVLGVVPMVVGEPVRLSQVVMNLLANAIQAIEAGAPEDNVVTLRLAERHGEVVLTVEDTGCGMTDDVRARAFEPFFTTKRRGEGTGLGLALCRRIAEEHGGTLECTSEPGVGSRFTMTLPMA